MFRNRWFALLFVGLTLAGVTRLIGTQDDGGALDDATKELIAQKQAADAFVQDQPSQATGDDVTVEFTPDEELIDPAEGDDPTPADQTAPPIEDPAEVPHDEVIIVSQDTVAPVEQSPPPTQ